MAPAHATVDSTLAKFRMPGTSCLTTCALAAVAIRTTTVNSASVGISGCMPAPPFERCSLPLRGSPLRRASTLPCGAALQSGSTHASLCPGLPNVPLDRLAPANGHRIPDGRRVAAVPILAGLHHEYRLEPLAA